MTSRARRRARPAAAERAAPEAGVAPDEQNGGEVAPPLHDGVLAEAPPEPPQQPPTQIAAAPEPEQPRIMAELSGSMLADIRARNDAVDKARKDAIEATLEADHKRRIADYAQEALSGIITRLVQGANLDPDFVYRVNIDSGRIEAAGPRQGPRPV